MTRDFEDRCADCVHRKMSDVVITGSRCDVIILCDKDGHWHPAGYKCEDCVGVPAELPPWVERMCEV